jgi:hypothetical protein
MEKEFRKQKTGVRIQDLQHPAAIHSDNTDRGPIPNNEAPSRPNFFILTPEFCFLFSL